MCDQKSISKFKQKKHNQVLYMKYQIDNYIKYVGI